MSIVRSRVLFCLVVSLWLPVVAAAQGPAPPRVSLVAVPEGGVQLLVTRIDPVLLLAQTTLLPPGGGSQAQGTAPSLGGAALPSPVMEQRFLTRYTDTAGWKHLLETTELPDETPDAHALRHAAALAELLLQFPPAAGAPPTLASSSLEPGEQILKTAWKGADGLDHEVVTARKPSENMDKWAERHADGVAAMLKLFPPKPGFSMSAGHRAARLA